MNGTPTSPFTPNFSFSPGASAPLFPRDTEIHDPSSSILRYPPPSAIPSHVYGSFAGRRSSLPTNASPGIGPRDYNTPSFKLARIQSLPDADVEAPPTDEQMEADRAFMVDRVLENARALSIGYDSAAAQMGKEATGQGSGMEAIPSFAGVVGEENKFNSITSRGLASALVGESSSRHHGRLKKRERMRLEKARLAGWKKWLGWGVVTKGEIFKILIAGIIAGWGIAGMRESHPASLTRKLCAKANAVHLMADYIGQRSIVSIPYIAYQAGAVVGSVVIACSAVVIGLYIMFIILRPKLKHGWPVKIGVALVLGAAVCLMHYVGMTGECNIQDRLRATMRGTNA